MEDILASIRRILSEDEPPPAAEGSEKASPETDNPGKGGPGKGGKDPDPDVLVLDPSMMVEEPTPNAPVEQPMTPEAQSEPVRTEPVRTEPARAPEPTPQTVNSDAHGGGLVAPEAAAAAASSVGTLVRTLTGRSAQLHQGGPTLEDLVRDELRPILKQWLDVNLPPLVERLVRIEIERVVGRADL
jgi:cell pole-organizing protein PopZ